MAVVVSGVVLSDKFGERCIGRQTATMNARVRLLLISYAQEDIHPISYVHVRPSRHSTVEMKAR